MKNRKKIVELYKKYRQNRQEKGGGYLPFDRWFINIQDRNKQEAKDTGRTYQEFVQDLISDGRNLKEVLTVARNTRWASKIQEVEEYTKKFLVMLGKSS